MPTQKKHINRETLKLYWAEVRNFQKSFWFMLVCIPTNGLLLDTLLPFFLSISVGALTEGNTTAMYHALYWAGGVGLLGVVSNILGFQAMTWHESQVRAKLIRSTFDTLMRKDMRFFVNEKVGALTSRFIDFVRAETSLQDLFIIRTLGFILSMSVGLVLIALQSWVLCVAVLLLLVSLFFQIRWSLRKREPWRAERKRLVAEINGIAADAVTNNVVVKTFAREDEERRYLGEKTLLLKESLYKYLSFMAWEGTGRILLMVLMQVGSMAAAAAYVMAGQMDVATTIFVLTYLQRISSQLFTLGEMINGYDQALLEAAPMTEMLLKDSLVVDAPDALSLAPEDMTVTFEQVYYRYEDGTEDVLSGIDLVIPQGQRVGVVGFSGAGKTTLTHLLLRFVDVTGGRILIGGTDIRQVTQKSLRAHIGYVPQESMLFHRSIRENIAYGNLTATEEDIIQAAKQAHAWEFIQHLPKGLNTIVGERGVKLSGGQRQRIAIARAMLKNAPMLILDEATSALDSESEQLIKEALNTLMQGRTALVIAHRLSTISSLDRLLVVDGGRIVEDGTHQELLTRGGIYAKLWAMQSGGFVGE